MMLFWSLIALLALIALAFVWLPFIRNASARLETVPEREQQNVQIFKSRIEELESELKAGTLDQASFDELKRELEEKLLEDVGESAAQAVAYKTGGRWAPLALTLILPAAALALYLQWGFSQELAMPAQQQSVPAGHPGGVEDQVAQLKARLAENPDNSQGWFTLGRTYLALQRYDEAYQAFVKVGELVGDHAEILSQQAQALYFRNGHQMNGEIEALITRALELDASDPGTLGLLGIYSYEVGQYQDAIGYWQRMLDNLRPGVNREGLEAAINEAKAKLASQGITYQAPDKPVGGGASIQVQVGLDEGLKSQVGSDQVVFVYAQAVNGPRMPLAVAKLQVKDLPTSVVLDDSMAMGPMLKLSSVDQVQIKATITRSGTPGAKTGDLIGQVSPVAVGGDRQMVNVTIDQVVQ